MVTVCVRAHLREVWAAAKGIQPNRTAFPGPSAAQLADESLLSDPEEASLRKEWRMPFPAMGQNNDPQAIRRSCPSRDYVACFTKELRERYPFTQYHKRHPPPSCYTGAARARAVPALPQLYREVLCVLARDALIMGGGEDRADAPELQLPLHQIYSERSGNRCRRSHPLDDWFGPGSTRHATGPSRK